MVLPSAEGGFVLSPSDKVFMLLPVEGVFVLLLNLNSKFRGAIIGKIDKTEVLP
jgi:hypothetical protein